MRRTTLRIIAIYIALIFINVNISAQAINNVVVDSLNCNYIPFVNIYNLRNGMNINTSNIGRFKLGSIKHNSNDTLVFNVNGYYEKKIAVQNIRDTIKLTKAPFVLTEITIKKKHIKTNKRNGTIVINRINKKKCFVIHQPISTNDKPKEGLWIPFHRFDPDAEAVFIPYKEEYNKRYIKKVVVLTFSYNTPPAFFKIMLYSCVNNKPGKHLLTKPINITLNKNRNLTAINLTGLNIKINKPGVFVSFENMKIPNNATVFIRKNKIEKNDCKYYDVDYKDVKTDSIAAIIYSPFLCYYPVKEQYSYWVRINSEWFQKSVLENNYLGFPNRKRYFKPAIQLVLSEISKDHE